MKKKQSLIILPIAIAFLFACQFLGQPTTNEDDSVVQTKEAIPQPTPVFTIESQIEPTASDIVEIVDGYNVSMMLVPAGDFIMGTDGTINDNPTHQIYLDGYYLDKYEVTNAHYKTCVDSDVCELPYQLSSKTRPSYYGNTQFDNYPVLAVDYDQAKIYCEWRGSQLPTEAQWEKAARGTDERRYPWGNEQSDPTFANYDDNQGDTTVVGSYESGVSPYGVYDMAGNVWEWVADWYAEKYYQNSPTFNPTGPDDGVNPVVRGGAWNTNWSQLEVFHRFINPPNRYTSVGFRCAKDVP